jgi:putative transposase
VQSLEEAGTELLTLHRLQVGGELRRCLATTNMVESLISGIRVNTNRIKRSSVPDQALRWSASAIQVLRKRFIKLRGVKAVPALLQNLNQFALEKKAA